MLQFKKEFEKDLFALEVRALDESYDPAVRMCTSYRGKNGYHSRLSDCTVHEIRKSFDYAYQLLNRDGEGDRERAHDILYRVIALQDMNPARNTYGIWQYFLEEDLEEMNPPDWNWADFNGKSLLQILNEHDEKLSEDIKARMRDSICHACRAIIKRNVQPSYTNISVMGAYVTLYAGESMGNEEFFTYGKNRLRALHSYNMSHGNFSEFNSPTYTFICLEDLSALHRDIRDEECKQLSDDLIKLAWETVALHFHIASGQLAGPHDRAYAFLLADSTKLSIERALDYKIKLIDDYRIFNTQNIGNLHFTCSLSCPEQYIPYFTETTEERILDQTFAPGRMAYTYIHDVYTIGSLHCECAWNQHRNVLGYFGSVKEPVAFNLKCLHDDWDYCSAHMATVQEKGRTLTAFAFATDGGDTHVCLDMVKNAAIQAKDFRIRALFEGATCYLTAEQLGASSFRVTDLRNGLTVFIDFPYAKFGDLPVQFAVVRMKNQLGIDAVLYSGEERIIDFGSIENAMIVVAVEYSIDGQRMPNAPITVREDGANIVSSFGNLTVSMSRVPDKGSAVSKSVSLFRNGEAYRPAF